MGERKLRTRWGMGENERSIVGLCMSCPLAMRASGQLEGAYAAAVRSPSIQHRLNISRHGCGSVCQPLGHASVRYRVTTHRSDPSQLLLDYDPAQCRAPHDKQLELNMAEGEAGSLLVSRAYQNAASPCTAQRHGHCLGDQLAYSARPRQRQGTRDDLR